VVVSDVGNDIAEDLVEDPNSLSVEIVTEEHGYSRAETLQHDVPLENPVTRKRKRLCNSELWKKNQRKTLYNTGKLKRGRLQVLMIILRMQI